MSAALTMVPLTDNQRKLLKPMLDSIKTGNRKGQGLALFAQAFHDGFVVKVLTEDEVKHVQGVLGGHGKYSSAATYSSAADRMRVQS